MSYLDIQETIKKAVANTQHIAAKKGITISFINIHHFKLNYDEDRILQVFTNLIFNAIKFCEPTSGHIEVDYKLGDEVLIISIKDNGKGIPVEDIDSVFDKFYQSQNQNTMKPEGSGLGLAISKKIIEKHKGEIWADMQIKRGAKFVFTLPIH